MIGIVVTDEFEIFFDTLAQTRKAHNLRRNAAIAFVIGGTGPGDEPTVQYEGVAEEPRGAELERLKALYFGRYSDFNRTPPEIVELDSGQLSIMV